MKLRKLVDWPYVIGLMLLPFFIMGIFLMLAFIQDLTRYNPHFFNAEFQERYAVPNDVITDLENALMRADSELLSETQGTKSAPQQLIPNPNLRFMIMLEADGKYFDYLFMDTTNYQRFPQHLKQVNGRYVRVPEGLYYLVDSRKWISTFFPLAAIWWLIVILFTIGIWFFRVMAAYRRKRFGARESGN
jgi:hypothetical protein